MSIFSCVDVLALKFNQVKNFQLASKILEDKVPMLFL